MAGISKAEREARAAAAAAAGQGSEGAGTEMESAAGGNETTGDGAGDQRQETGGEAPALVRMTRGDEHPAPHEADVHPDEVGNFAAGGWTVAG